MDPLNVVNNIAHRHECNLIEKNGPHLINPTKSVDVHVCECAENARNKKCRRNVKGDKLGMTPCGHDEVSMEEILQGRDVVSVQGLSGYVERSRGVLGQLANAVDGGQGHQGTVVAEVPRLQPHSNPWGGVNLNALNAWLGSAHESHDIIFVIRDCWHRRE